MHITTYGLFQTQAMQTAMAVSGIVVLIGTYLGSFLYGLKLGKSKAEEHRIRPFKEAAEGWESSAGQAREEIASLKLRVVELEKKVEQSREREREVERQKDELKDDLIFAARANFKLQGEIERLSSRITLLEQFHK